MKKLTLLLAVILLSGCTNAKEQNEIQLCDDVKPYIEKYNSGEITFKEVVNNLDGLYTKYCSSESNTCNTIISIQNQNKVTYELKDCTTSKENKELCELNNKLTQDLIDKKEPVERALIYELSRDCELVKEK